MAFSRLYKDHFRQMPKLASIDRALENCCPHNYKARRPYKKWLRFERLSVLIFMTTSIISQPITSLSHGIRRLYWHYVPHTLGSSLGPLFLENFGHRFWYFVFGSSTVRRPYVTTKFRMIGVWVWVNSFTRPQWYPYVPLVKALGASYRIC